MVRNDTSPSDKETDRLKKEQSSEKSPQKSDVGDFKNDQNRNETPLKTPLVKLGDLTESQRKIAMQMLTEEWCGMY